MSRRKTLQELTLKDNFMFAAVMMDTDICREFLELVLGFPIAKVEVSREKSIVYHPEYRGVRLDIYAKDEQGTRYNVEMQVLKKPQLVKCIRFYHSQMDMELLNSGMDYTELPDTYVIFLCDFDPFSAEKFCYTYEAYCRETGQKMRDGSYSIFLCTMGNNLHEVPEEMVKFLQYVKANQQESEQDFGDDFVRRIQESVRKIKVSRKMEERYMVLEEMLQEEREEGKAEGRAEAILELLEELGPLSEEVRKNILEERNLQRLREMHKAAAHAATLEQFLEHIGSKS